jgi:hypothetical protein
VTCSYGSNAKEHGEHLHRHCRGCQYDWIDPVRAASPVSVTADQEAGDE